MCRSVILPTLFALACVPPESPTRSEPTNEPALLASANASQVATIAPTASVVIPSANASPEDGPVPSAWGCPPIDAPIEHVADTTATVLASAGTDLYWADGDGVWVKSSGAEARKLSRGTAHVPPQQLVVTDEELLLLSSREVGNTCASVVQSIPRSATSTTAPKTIFSGRCVKHIAASKQHVAFHVATYHLGEDWTSGNAYLLDREKPGQPTKLDFDLPEESALALTDTKLFAAHNGGRIYASRLEHPSRFELVTQTSAVRVSFSSHDMRILALDDDFAYFYSSGATNTALRVLRVKKEGSVAEVMGLFPRETARPPGQGFVASQRYLYFTVPQEGAVYRADKQGKCGVERVAEGRKSANGLTFMDGAIHWTETSKPSAVYRRKE